MRAPHPGARPSEGRFVGSPWAPFRAETAVSGQKQPREAVLAGTTHRGSTAAAQLSVHGSAAALERATEVSAEQRDAVTWSDLAALYIRRARETASPVLYVEAVAAADSALHLRPEMPEALFNRAIALEFLGLRVEAADAWRGYLRVDPSGDWASEARTRLRMLEAMAPEFDQLLAEARLAILDGDGSAAARLAGPFPHQSMKYALTQALGGWGRALMSNDEPSAIAHVAVARALGLALARTGDTLVADCVATVDAASGRDRERLARAHAAYLALVEERAGPTAREPRLREIIPLLDAAGSPMTETALYHAAIAVFDQNRTREAGRALAELATTVPARYRMLRAGILWQQGLVHGAETDWGGAISSLDQSARLFDAAGDAYSAAVVRQILTEVYDAIGDAESAWRVRTAVLHEVGRTRTLRTQTAISAISYSAAQAKNWRAAVSMLDLEVAISAEVDDAPSRLDALLRRAVAQRELQRHERALDDLSSAMAVAAAMEDPAQRGRTEADIAVVEALIAGSPATAVARLTDAIEFHARGGREMYLPLFHLERGRAFASAGDRDAARRDYRAGIERLESQRLTLDDVTARLGIFDAAEELFVAAIEDALARGDAREALELAERGRARTLLDRLAASPATPSIPTQTIARDVAIVEYVSLSNDIAAFVVTNRGVEVVRLPHRPPEVARTARRLRDALARGDSRAPLRESRALHSALFEPLVASLSGRSEVVLITGRETAAIPFAALRDRDGTYLIERYVVRAAPSIAAYLQLPSVDGVAPARALVLAASRPDDADALHAVDREARAIASHYTSPTVLLGPEVTSANLARHAASATVLHFAGHGLSPASHHTTAALVMSPAGHAEALTAEEIESLRLRDTRVVVLAACNSARGEEKWSEGTLSVARAFLAAGAPSVIATLWKVEDEQAAAFFPDIHSRLAQGLPPATALRETQLHWIRTRGEQSTVWAAVQAIGR